MLQQHQTNLKVATQGKNLHNITPKIQQVVQKSGIQTGLCCVFVRHTSASLIIQENADPNVLADLETFFSHLVPEDPHRYRHNDEGLDDMPSHIRSALTKTTEQIPIRHNHLVLGIWQGIYLWEHRAHQHQREIVVHVNGEK